MLRLLARTIFPADDPSPLFREKEVPPLVKDHVTNWDLHPPPPGPVCPPWATESPNLPLQSKRLAPGFQEVYRVPREGTWDPTPEAETTPGFRGNFKLIPSAISNSQHQKVNKMLYDQFCFVYLPIDTFFLSHTVIYVFVSRTDFSTYSPHSPSQ